MIFFWLINLWRSVESVRPILTEVFILTDWTDYTDFSQWFSYAWLICGELWNLCDPCGSWRSLDGEIKEVFADEPCADDPGYEDGIANNLIDKAPRTGDVGGEDGLQEPHEKVDVDNPVP